MRGYYDTFVKTCAKHPSRIAVRQYDDGWYKCYTYSELYGVCEYISQNLQQLKCNKGVIGLVAERNIAIPCVIAAAHKCCTTFMFIDPSQDVETLARDIDFTVIITINANKNESSNMFGKKPDTTISVFDLTIHFYACELPETPNSLLISQHSFIALTSGSTGEPKQIQVPIQCLQPNVDDLTKMFKITPDDIIYFSTPLTFDPSMIEILLACINGASLLIAPDKAEILFPEDTYNSITFWQTTPSKFFQYSNDDIKNKILSAESTLKTLALGGEPLSSIKRLKELKDWENKTKVFVLYGVTEMSCWACAVELDLYRMLGDKEIPLGTCLSETELVIDTDDDKNTGKIVLVSKTRQCIILNTYNGHEAGNSLKFVDTGDLGEIKNGTVYFRGRKDDIIKRFGHKVNLQLIESTIMLCPKVKTCSCIWLPKPFLLVVYFTSEELTTQELHDFLKCKLDDKYWPDKIVRVHDLPTSPNGKITKQLVLKMHESFSNDTVGQLASEDMFRIHFIRELRAVLSSNFTFDQIRHKPFFAFGGTSFRALSLCNRMTIIYPQLGQLILPHLLSQKKTIDDIMNLIQKQLCGGDTRGKRPAKRVSADAVSLTSTKKTSTEIALPPIDITMHWTYDTGKCVDASPSFFQRGNNIYITVGSHSGNVVIVEAASGKLQGMVSLKSRIEASVLCFEDEGYQRGVVGAYDGTVSCFSLEDYKEVWRVKVGAMIKSKAVCCSGFIYVASYDGNVSRLDIKTGEVIEKVRVAEQAISADLVLAKNQYILIGALSGVCASLHIATNLLSWRNRLGSPVFANPVLYDDDKYVVFAEVNGDIHCRTVEKGIKIWKFQGAKGNIFSSFFIKKLDKLKWQLIFGCHDDKVYSINIKNFQPSLQWTTILTSPVYATPCALMGDLILAIATNGRLSVIDSEQGLIVTEFNLPNECFSSPLVRGEYIFVGCRDDHLYSLKYVISINNISIE